MSNNFLLNQDVDQSTPKADLEKLNSTKNPIGFWESVVEADLSAKYDLMHLMILGSEIGVLPISFGDQLTGKQLSPEELNKKYGVNTFKDSMTDSQAFILVELQKQKNLAFEKAGDYSDRTFLGQNLPQWIGGITGGLANPLNAVPWGKALPPLGGATANVLGRLGMKNPSIFNRLATNGTMQSVTTNGFGSMLDMGIRKSLETRTGEEITWANVAENIIAGTLIGTGIDTAIGSIEKKLEAHAESKGKYQPKTNGIVEESAALEVAAARFESGLPTEGPKVQDAFVPTPEKPLKIYTHDKLKESTLVSDDPDFLGYGFTEVQKVDGTAYKVGDKEFSSLEEANLYAYQTKQKIKVEALDNGNQEVKQIEVDPVENMTVDNTKVDALAAEFDDEVTQSGHTQEEVDAFRTFTDNLQDGAEIKQMEATIEQVKLDLSELKNSSETPDAYTTKGLEDIAIQEKKGVAEESAIKAITNCIIKGLSK